MRSIVHLDRERARDLVRDARRAAVLDGRGRVMYDRADPLVAATHGRLTLGPPTWPDAPATAIGHYQTALRLPGVRRLPLSVARELVRHPLLALDCVERVTDEVAAILATHTGVTLALRGITQISAAARARLEGNPGIELSRRFYA